MRKAEDLDVIRHRLGRGPRVFVESGTFHGKTTRWALERFHVVHTIEQSDDLYAAAAEALTPLGARCHHGDTRDVLPTLAASIDEPVFWFLDAHWLNREHAAGKGTSLPLREELAALAQRPYDDIVCVDDVFSFGKDEYQAGWGEVSLDWIAEFFPAHRLAKQYKDVAVIYR
jgi:hypothetical protein